MHSESHKKIKPIFSGHETFPLRYGWLKKIYDAVKTAESADKDAKAVFSDPEATSLFGVGKNMVSSMRHWAILIGILNDNKLSYFAHKLLATNGLDPWMEFPSTLWLLHFQLAKNINLVTYYWFFNHYNGAVFDRKTLNEQIKDWIEYRTEKKPASLTLQRDVECFIRTYASKEISHTNPNDDSIESPLSELSLIRPQGINGRYTPNRGSKPTLSLGVFFLCLAEFWHNSFKNNISLSLESLAFDAGSPGRIFLLDEDSLLEYIYKLSEQYGKILNWSETAGMRQISRKSNVKIEQIKVFANNLIEREYQLL